MTRLRAAAAIAAAALAACALALWPDYVRSRADAARASALPVASPVNADYATRDRVIAFWEHAANERHRGDMLSPATLSEEYLQRFRERGDVGDALRAESSAERSLAAQPYGNGRAELALASAFIAMHRFHEALDLVRDVERFDSADADLRMHEASIDLELGRYADAGRIVRALRGGDVVAVDTLRARYDELTGQIAEARMLIEHARVAANAHADMPAQQRAWLAYRSGELAFEAGDDETAIADERDALGTFPEYADANRLLARFTCAMHRWDDCLAAATASARVVPYPEVLGYEVDAQRALGRRGDAAQTDALIVAVDRIGNAQHIADRLLAIYYAEHDEHLQEAYAIAKRELAVRDDVLTEDTIAWCAVKTGRWTEARLRMAAAMRYGTQHALLFYHAGVVAQHFGDRVHARRYFSEALRENGSFHAVYAPDARARLATL